MKNNLYTIHKAIKNSDEMDNRVNTIVDINDQRDVSWWNHKLKDKRNVVKKSWNETKLAKDWTHYIIDLTEYNSEIKELKGGLGRNTVKSLMTY